MLLHDRFHLVNANNNRSNWMTRGLFSFYLSDFLFFLSNTHKNEKYNPIITETDVKKKKKKEKKTNDGNVRYMMMMMYDHCSMNNQVYPLV